MSRVRGKDTGIERLVLHALYAEGFRFQIHAKNLPGRPDVVFRSRRLVIFVDGDFWHGWRFPAWKNKLPPFWESKISGNRARDVRNFAALRRRGWRVIRIWEHQIESDLAGQVARVIGAFRKPVDRRPSVGR